MTRIKTLIFQTPGERLKLAREATLLSARDFCREHDISYGTFMTWVYGDRNISERKADFLVTCLLKHRVVCSREWLLHGKGMFPVKLK